jgi:hypothetical protein
MEEVNPWDFFHCLSTVLTIINVTAHSNFSGIKKRKYLTGVINSLMNTGQVHEMPASCDLWYLLSTGTYASYVKEKIKVFSVTIYATSLHKTTALIF